MTSFLSVKDLSIQMHSQNILVANISFDLNKGETLAIIGQSGGGKTVTASAIFGLLPPGLKACGSVQLGGYEVLNVTPGVRLRKYKLEQLFLVQQSMTAFDPLSTIGQQIIETLRSHKKNWSVKQCLEIAEDALTRLHFSDSKSVLKKYPCELSGGMLQRCMLSFALCLKPTLINADKHTSELEIVSSRKVIDQFIEIKEELQTAIILVTHDLRAAAPASDKCLLMKAGREIAFGTPNEVLNAENDYSKLMKRAVDKLRYKDHAALS